MFCLCMESINSFGISDFKEHVYRKGDQVVLVYTHRLAIENAGKIGKCMRVFYNRHTPQLSELSV